MIAFRIVILWTYLFWNNTDKEIIQIRNGVSESVNVRHLMLVNSFTNYGVIFFKGYRMLL